MPVGGAELVGSLLRPAGASAHPLVLLLGGTFSDLRDGDVEARVRPGVPPHRMYRILAEGLADAGVASFRFDRRGCGESTGELGTGRAQEIADASDVWDWLVARFRPPATGMIGESAGAYVLCRLAGSGRIPEAAVLQGALHRSIAGLIQYNADIARHYVESSAAASGWTRANAPQAYRDALLGERIVEAIERGADEVGIEFDGQSWARDLTGLAYDLDHPPADQFSHLTCPVLVIHGADDLNVPVEDAFATVSELWRAGNHRVDLEILAGADHSFQIPADHPEIRVRERLTLESFARPFHPSYPSTIARWIANHLEIA